MEEKPFPASQKKLKKARQKGEVYQSKLLASALFFLGTLILLRLCAPFFYRAFVDLMHFQEAFSLKPLMTILTLFWMGVIVLGVAVHLAQIGWLFTPSSLKPKWNVKIHVEWSLLFVAVDIAIILSLALILIRPDLNWILMHPASKLALVCEKCFMLALIIAFSLVLIGLLDWKIGKTRFMKKMGMTAAEKAEEERENEVKK